MYTKDEPRIDDNYSERSHIMLYKVLKKSQFMKMKKGEEVKNKIRNKNDTHTMHACRLFGNQSLCNRQKNFTLQTTTDKKLFST